MGVNTDRSNEYSDFAGFTGLKFSYKGHEDVIFTLPYVTNEAMSMLYRIFLDLVPVPIISERFLMDTLER